MSINNLNTYLNVRDAHLRVVSGNVYAQAMNIGGINVETAHGLQSVSDTGNVTSNTLQFSNATTGFVTTANVNIGRDLVVTGNATVSTDLTVSANATVTDTLTVSEHLLASKEATVTGNLHVMTVMSDSNIVAEYTGPHDRPLRKYPEVALTADAATASGYKGYKVTSSFDHTTYQDWNAFDGVTDATVGWHTGSAATNDIQYTGTDGEYNGTNATQLSSSSNTVNGEYLQVELPKAIKLKYYVLYPQGTSGVDQYNSPTRAVLYGSNDGSVWTEVHRYTDAIYDTDKRAGIGYTFHVNSNQSYNYFAIVPTHRDDTAGTPANTSGISIGELEFYGHEEGSGSLDTTLKTVYNVPATTGTQLEVYYDAKGESTVQSPIPDLSPNTNTGAVSGHSPTLDSTDGIDSFKFNGSSQYVTGTHGLTTGSDPVHTISLWFKRTAKVNQFDYLVQLGEGGTSHQQSAIFIDDDKIGHGHWGSGVYQTDVITDNVWYHVAATFTGGNTSDLSAHKIYVNGVEKGINAYSSDGPLVLTGTALTLGRNENALGSPGGYFNGSIANFRLYSKALNADQVKELYEYQKDYFLGSKSQVTLYKGHLGVGVTEPSGQLELAGDERIQEYPPRAITVLNYHTHIEGHGEFEFYSSQGTWDSTYVNNASWDFTRAFTPRFTTDGGWHGDSVSAPGSYQVVLQYAPAVTSGDGHVESILKDGSTIFGDWVEMRSPYAINVTKLATAPRTNYGNSRGIGKFAILGSNNGIDWEYAGDGAIAPYNPSSSTDAGGYGTYGSETIARVSTNSNGRYYTYHRLVVTHIMGHRGASGHPNYSSGNSESVNQSYIRFYGTPGPTTLDKGSLSLTRSLDVPRVSRYDVDTETPRPEKLLVDFDTTVNSSPTDISGQGNHARYINGASYSLADKAFSFDGGAGCKVEGESGFVGGTVAHSMSCWFKVGSGISGTTNAGTILSLGSYSSSPPGSQISALYVYDDRLGVYHWNNDILTEVGSFDVDDKSWHMMTYVHLGGAATVANQRIYLDGVSLPLTTTGVTHTGGNLVIAANAAFSVGATAQTNSNMFTGLVSNPKLYNVALEPSEVRKLYKLGRTGRSMVISDTAVGIGKVPEAQLDVRGNLNVSSFIKYDSAWFYAYDGNTSGTGDFSDYTGYVPWAYLMSGSNHFITASASTSGGYYTAPVDGIYHFDTSVLNYPDARSGITGIYFSVNDRTDGTSYSSGYNRKTNMPGQENMNASLTTKLNEGDTVKVYVVNIDCYTQTNHAFFSGYLITRI
jgi:hypothetical protein